MKKISSTLNPEIKTYDIDVTGHVNNAVYIQWIEDLRTKLFNEHFDLPGLIKKNLYPVVTSTDIQYKKFLKLFDKPVGVIKLESFNHGVFTLDIEIKIEGKIAIVSKQHCVLFDLIKLEMIKSSKLWEILPILFRE